MRFELGDLLHAEDFDNAEFEFFSRVDLNFEFNLKKISNILKSLAGMDNFLKVQWRIIEKKVIGFLNLREKC